ncbi:MAG: hypothetical protein ACM31C_22460 [Acidobacteriota bacterium]
MFALAACAQGAPGHDEPADFDPVDWSGGKADAGGSAVFDKNTIMTELVFGTSSAVDADAVQQFLEDNPYGRRSWLADVQLDGVRFSDELVEVAQQHDLDPVVLLARMQVETSLVSATARPSSFRIAHALGCGCPDSSGCSSADSGLDTQLQCAGDVLSRALQGSRDGSGGWVAGASHRTDDGYRVTPSDDATAALYAYTPWVLVGSGGNWLVWNVTRKYLKHFDQAGTLQLP